MYQFKEGYDPGFFWFDKKLIENGNWAMLPKASKAVYPVICCFRNNKSGEAFPCEQTIAILSGRSDKIVRKGIRGLEEFPGVEIKKYLTRSGKKGKKFIIENPPEERGRSFIFHSEIMTGGVWLHLSSCAQALYPVMRHYAQYDYDLGDGGEESAGDAFSRRRHDICGAEIGVMAEAAGIARRRVKGAIDELQAIGCLVEPLEDDYYGWKVLLQPSSLYKVGHLNKLVMRKYRHLKD
jgi:biotin operon repressor